MLHSCCLLVSGKCLFKAWENVLAFQVNACPASAQAQGSTADAASVNAPASVAPAGKIAARLCTVNFPPKVGVAWCDPGFPGTFYYKQDLSVIPVM